VIILETKYIEKEKANAVFIFSQKKKAFFLFLPEFGA